MKSASAFFLTIERFRHPEAMDEITSVRGLVQLLCSTESLCAGSNDKKALSLLYSPDFNAVQKPQVITLTTLDFNILHVTHMYY